MVTWCLKGSFPLNAAGHRGAELDRQLDVCVPTGYVVVDAVDVIHPFAVCTGDYVMFNWARSA